VLQLDDPTLLGIEGNVSLVVVAAEELAAPTFSWSASGSVPRADTRSYFVNVPQGASALQVDLSGIAQGSVFRFVAFHPDGIAVDPTGDGDCYTNRADDGGCDPLHRTYTDPAPGVWEIVAEARRTSPVLDNPYSLQAQLLGVDVQPELIDIPSAAVGDTVPLTWTVTNRLAPVTFQGQGGPLGSAAVRRPTIADGQTLTFEVEVPAGADRLDVQIGSPADQRADLDLFVSLDGVLVAADADADAEESVSIPDPVAGTYTVEVDGFDVPSGSTEFDYRDVYFTPTLGTLTVTSGPVTLGSGESTEVTGSLSVAAPAGEGRSLFGEMSLVTPTGGVVGTGAVVVREVRP
jgi:hypothetical protein